VPAAVEYQTRLAARRATCATFDVQDARFAYARLAVFGVGLLLLVLVWRTTVAPAWIVLPVLAFVWLARGHDRLRRARDQALRLIRLYESGLARLEDRWAGTGETGERFRNDAHVYANDLDLFGRGSLFELLSQARTRTGEETLARWLTTFADEREIRARQEAVAELDSALDLRERVAVAGADVRSSVKTDRLLAWAESPLQNSATLRAATWVFTAATVAGVAYLATTGIWAALGMVLLLQATVFRRLRDQMNDIVSASDPETRADFVADALTHRVMDLDVVADLLHALEQERFSSQRLVALRHRLGRDGVPASAIIRRLHRMALVHDSERGTLVIPLSLFMFGYLNTALILGALFQLIRPHVAVAVDNWRRSHGPQIREWLESVAEIEALLSLASYRYERADDPFPEIVSGNGTSRPDALFDGTKLGHPLLPASTMVRNDVHLASGTQLLVVSGSNMSGKSTLLRTVGVNAVLAMAGAPVRAASLRLSPLAIGATLRIQDSLQEGRSRFYAEIVRIREIADLATGPAPLLFLLDELFHGTNSHDRLVGASGVLQGLLDRGAIGLITTHDLALTAVADRLAPRAVNVHFEDWFEGDQMQFDYLMKPGPVTRSNAIALMRAVGLDVPPAASTP
jgi:hypothetical protein